MPFVALTHLMGYGEITNASYGHCRFKRGPLIRIWRARRCGGRLEARLVRLTSYYYPFSEPDARRTRKSSALLRFRDATRSYALDSGPRSVLSNGAESEIGEALRASDPDFLKCPVAWSALVP